MTVPRLVLTIVNGLLASVVLIGLIPNQASAAPATGFDPGRIIDDSVFVDFQSMSRSSIQSFLNSKGAGCTSGSNCLKNYSKSGKSAAQMIYEAAQKYKINPKALIVLLQKETSLVTMNNPESWRYRTATGYGCPDTAACDTQYYGLANQLNWSAKMFSSIIRKDPNWYSPYRAGYNPRVYWHPDTGRCGSKPLTIQNWGTAALYSYTPYRPNQAALDAGYGTGNSCSAYGNRNFYLYFKDWFGRPNSANDSLLISCDDGKRYMLESTQTRKRLMPSEAQTAWGLSSSDFVNIDYACSYPTFELPMSNMVRSRDSGKVYLVDKAVAYSITSQDQASAWNLGSLSEEHGQADGNTISRLLSTQSTLPRIATSDNPDRDDVYLVDNTKRYTINGTPESDMSSYQILTSSNKIPTATVSVSLLQTLDLAPKKIDYIFSSGGSKYLADGSVLKRISPETMGLWTEQSSPTEVSNQAISIFNGTASIGDGFYSEKNYYKLTSYSTLSRTTSGGVASNWSSYGSPSITSTLKNEILTRASVNKVEIGLSPSNNIRIVTCNNQPHMVERYIKAKRMISTTGMSAWRLTDKYFYINDRACDYSTYSLSVGDVVRSRDSGKLYKLQNYKAYWLYNSARARQLGVNPNIEYPQFDSASISNNFQTTR